MWRLRKNRLKEGGKGKWAVGFLEKWQGENLMLEPSDMVLLRPEQGGLGIGALKGDDGCDWRNLRTVVGICRSGERLQKRGGVRSARCNFGRPRRGWIGVQRTVCSGEVGLRAARNLDARSCQWQNDRREHNMDRRGRTGRIREGSEEQCSEGKMRILMGAREGRS